MTIVMILSGFTIYKIELFNKQQPLLFNLSFFII